MATVNRPFGGNRFMRKTYLLSECRHFFLRFEIQASLGILQWDMIVGGFQAGSNFITHSVQQDIHKGSILRRAMILQYIEDEKLSEIAIQIQLYNSNWI